MPAPTAAAITTEEGCSSSNEEDHTMSTASGTLNSQELIENIRNRVRRQVVEEFLAACEGDEQKKAVVMELSAQVLGERITPPTVVERFSSLNEDSSSSSSSDDSSDQDNLKWAHVVSMESIERSPYEPGTSAEVGEELFEAFEDLMVPEKETKNTHRRCLGTLMEPSKQAVKVFGRETAQILITARHHISQSGMLFSTDWLNQRIREVEIKDMNKLVILVSLPEQRISRAEKRVLTTLVQHLRLADIIREVLDDLVGIGDSTQFPKLADCMETPYPYRRSQQTECQKCEVFVARAYTCMNYLKRNTIENETMVRKIFDCLSIMEENLEFELSTPPLRPPVFIDVPQPVVAGLHGKHGNGGGCDDKDDHRNAASNTLPSSKDECRLIEKLDLGSGMVLGCYRSIEEANISVDKPRNSTRILDFLRHCAKHDCTRHGSAYGFYWRYAGPKNLPGGIDCASPEQLQNSSKTLEHLVANSSGKTVSDAMQEQTTVSTQRPCIDVLLSQPVEQLSLENGKVLRRFNSIREANRFLGEDPGSWEILDVLEGRLKTAGGFLWRKVDTINVSKTSKVPNVSRAQITNKAAASVQDVRKNDVVSNIEKDHRHIEKLDMQTGLVIASYSSYEEANVCLGRRASCSNLKCALDGRYKSTGGYLWRFAGATESPGTGIANSSSASSKQSHTPHRKAPQTATSTNKETSNSIQQLVPKMGIVHESCPSLDHESEVPGVNTTSVQNHLNGDAPGASGPPVRDDQNSDRPNSNELANCRKRIGTDGNDADEIHLRKKLKASGPVEIVDGNCRISDPPTGIPLSSFSGRPSTRMISTMNDIDESPYQESATAEIGEEIFDKFKSLLQPESAPGCRHPQPSHHAVDVFGSVALANAVIEASSKIALSGMTYSDQWSEGTIYGPSIRDVPKAILLLLLQEQRFSRPSAEGALKKIVEDFDLCRKMIRALVRWKLAGRYSKLITATNHTAFGAHRSQCYKCLIFIARASICLETLKIERLPESIKRKVESCFGILQRNFGLRPRQPHKQAMGVDQANNVDEDERSIVSGFDCSSPVQQITESSHVLFQVQQVATASTTLPSRSAVVNPPSPSRVTSPVVHSSPKLSGTILRHGPDANSHAHTSWVPSDSEEVILKPLECEVAWLVEEARYCLRDRAPVHWRFLWKYASPTLRVELRRVEDGGDPSLEQLVRLQDKIVSERFSILRRDVRRKILKGNSRPRMKDAIDLERLASWRAQEKKNLPSAPSNVPRTSVAVHGPAETSCL